MVFPVRNWVSHKFIGGLKGNGPKPKNATTGAESPGHSWTLCAEMLDSRPHCHSCPQLADTGGHCCRGYPRFSPCLDTTPAQRQQVGELWPPACGLTARNPWEQEPGLWSLLLGSEPSPAHKRLTMEGRTFKMLGSSRKSEGCTLGHVNTGKQLYCRSTTVSQVKRVVLNLLTESTPDYLFKRM